MNDRVYGVFIKIDDKLIGEAKPFYSKVCKHWCQRVVHRANENEIRCCQCLGLEHGSGCGICTR